MLIAIPYLAKPNWHTIRFEVFKNGIDRKEVGDLSGTIGETTSEKKLTIPETDPGKRHCGGDQIAFLMQHATPSRILVLVLHVTPNAPPHENR